MKSLSVTLLLVCLCFFAKAQDLKPAPESEKESTFNWQMNFITGHPLADFKEAMTDDFGLGGDAALLFKVPKSPFSLGINFGAMLHQRERLRFERVVIADYTERFQLTTRSNSFFGHFVFRYEPKVDFPIRPYFDAYLGTQRLFTNTVLTSRDNNGDDNNNNTLDRVREQSDWVFSYGAGLGILIKLTDDEVFLNLSCSYLKSGNADFLVRTPGANVVDDTAEVFERRNSNIDLLMPKIGVVFRISECGN